MQRAYWSAEFSEAHAVEAMLRAHGFQAWAFDAALARLNWFYTLSFGGCRVMVPDSQATSALALLSQYRSGALSVADEDGDAPLCPRCAGNSIDDPRPRRVAFGALIASQAAGFVIFVSPALWWFVGLAPLLPLRRLRCSDRDIAA